MTRPVAVPESIISVRLPGADMGGMTTQADDMVSTVVFHLTFLIVVSFRLFPTPRLDASSERNHAGED